MFRIPRGALVAIAATAMVAVIACGSDSSTDSQAPAAAPDSPTATVSVPPIEPITASPVEDPAAFIAALPASERQCLVDTLGETVFGNLLAGEDPSDEDGRAILACLSNDTIQRVIVGQALALGGVELSDATLSCITDRLSTVDFISLGSLFFDDSGDGSDDLDTEQIAEVALSIFPAVFCLNDEERAAIGSSSSDDSGDNFFAGIFTGGTIDALECAFDAAGPEGLVSLIGIADEGVISGDAFAVVGAVIAECGELFAESGLLDGDDGSDLLSRLSGELELRDGIAIPELSDGLDLEDLLSGGDLEGLLGDLSGLADLDEISDLVATAESVPDGDIGSLVAPETVACLVDELGQEKVDGLLDGTLEPDFSILGAVLFCRQFTSIGN